VFVAALKNHYSECSEVVSQSGDIRLILIEKYYFRTNSHALGVVLIEPTGEGMFLASIIAGGGRAAMAAVDCGAEDQFVGEMKKILLDAEKISMAGKDNR
jgi:hypothetical protein